MNDPIADMLARLRNAATARHDRTEMPHSNLKESISTILKDEGYIEDFRVDRSGHPKLMVFLKYGRDRKAAFAGLRRASRPGRRLYVGSGGIPRVHNGLGVAIMSTSHGVMTGRSAQGKNVGGEVLCEVW